jgi:hypothetical protein
MSEQKANQPNEISVSAVLTRTSGVSVRTREPEIRHTTGTQLIRDNQFHAVPKHQSTDRSLSRNFARASMASSKEIAKESKNAKVFLEAFSPR